MLKILSYFSILFISFIFAYIFDVKESYIFFYMVLLMPVFDYIFLLLYKNKLEIEAKVSVEYMGKDHTNLYEVKFKNKSLFPIAYFSYEICLGDKLISKQNLNGANSIKSNGITNRSIWFRSLNIGMQKITLQKVEIKSLFGLFTSKFKGVVESSEVNILPNIVKIDRIESLIEDDINYESEGDNCANVFNGESGYEYKEYSEGDPLSKVNWKISSKTNSLYIRLNESYSKCKKVIVLDPHIIRDDNELLMDDLLIEGTIGIANEMLNYDFEVDLYYKHKGKWASKHINNNYDIRELQKLFASYAFSENTNRFIDLYIPTHKNVDLIILTNNNDNGILAFMNDLADMVNSIYIVSNNLVKIQKEEFYLSKDYSLERVKYE